MLWDKDEPKEQGTKILWVSRNGRVTQYILLKIHSCIGMKSYVETLRNLRKHDLQLSRLSIF